jgi:hypothetical protein
MAEYSLARGRTPIAIDTIPADQLSLGIDPMGSSAPTRARAGKTTRSARGRRRADLAGGGTPPRSEAQPHGGARHPAHAASAGRLAAYALPDALDTGGAGASPRRDGGERPAQPDYDEVVEAGAIQVGARVRITAEYAALLTAHGVRPATVASQRKGGVVESIAKSRDFPWCTVRVRLDEPVIYEDGTSMTKGLADPSELELLP